MTGKARTDLFSLKGKSALVTGGAGILGQHFCRGLAAAGANVAVLDLDAKQVAAQATELEREYGVKAIGLACDLKNEAEIVRAVQACVDRLGSIHILHNNAATKTSDLNQFFESTEKYSMETWKEIMSVNVDALFIAAREAAKAMKASGKGGVIINTASVYGVMAPDQRIYEGSQYMGRPINSPAIYSASKGAVVSLTRHLAALWAADGIRVNALVLGGVESGQNDVFFKKYSGRVPMGRMARAEEVVGPLIFLASEASSYVTGHCLHVDGGLAAW